MAVTGHDDPSAFARFNVAPLAELQDAVVVVVRPDTRHVGGPVREAHGESIVPDVDGTNHGLV